MNPLLGENQAEALRLAAAGRRPELLKESRTFDRERLEESPLFAGVQKSLFSEVVKRPDE